MTKNPPEPNPKNLSLAQGLGRPKEVQLDADGLDETEDLWRRAHRVLAAGTWSVSHGAFRYPNGVFPVLAQSGAGCRITDTTGAEYVDWMMGWGPVILGYRHPKVEAAIREQLAEGPLLSLLHPLEIEVAERIREVVPCADGVAFGKNGSDVLGAAARIARAHTGRERILVCGYHGFHDWYLASLPSIEGIPRDLRETVEPFPYGDLAALESIFEARGPQVAAIVMEPVKTQLPEPGYLAAVRDLAHRHGALLIFDELVTAFRLAPGGAQEAFGVEPDLACLGKAMGNGMPLSALTGREAVLRSIANVGYGLTFRGETLSLAAAKACLEVLATEPVTQHLDRVGRNLIAGFEEAVRTTGVPAELIGPTCRLDISFGPSGSLSALGLQTLFVQELLRHGVLSNGSLLASYAHDDAAVEQTVRAFHHGLEVVGRASVRGSLEGLLHVPDQAAFHEPSSLETPP